MAERTPCEVWTRVMGYFRPFSQFNIGKKSEHVSRKAFTEIVASNSYFVKKYDGNQPLYKEIEKEKAS